MGGLKTVEQNRLSVAKHYASNKDDILRGKILLRVSKGHMPQKVSMERYDLTEDEINAERLKGGLEPIVIKKKFKRSDAPPTVQVADAPLKKKISLEDVKNYYDETISNPNTRKTRYMNVKKVFQDFCPEALDNILPCLKKPKKLFTHILDNETNASTILVKFASLLHLVDYYPGLAEKVNRDLYFKMFEGAKEEADNHIIQKQLDDVVPAFSSIVKEVEDKYPSQSDEVIMVKLYDQITRRGDFIDIKIGKGTNEENYLVGDILHMNDIKKTEKEPFTEKLKPELMKLISQSLKDRPRKSLFVNAIKTVKNLGGVRLLRKAKASEILVGQNYHDPDKRKALAKNMGHGLRTQSGYIRKLKDS